MRSLKMISLALVICLCFCACGGRVYGVKLVVGSSDRYEEAEIREAMDLVLKQFQKGFQGCRLTELTYDEEISNRSCDGWAEQFEAVEGIVLTSTFTVGTKSDGSLTPNSTYRNWQWVLVRDNGETWMLKTWGYG